MPTIVIIQKGTQVPFCILSWQSFLKAKSRKAVYGIIACNRRTLQESLRHSESELGVDVDIVIPGEEIGGRPLRLRQAHHLRKTRPGTAIEIGDALGSDDRDIARTLDHHRTAVQPGITDSLTLIGQQHISSLQYTANGHCYRCWHIPHITKT